STRALFVTFPFVERLCGFDQASILRPVRLAELFVLRACGSGIGHLRAACGPETEPGGEALHDDELEHEPCRAIAIGEGFVAALEGGGRVLSEEAFGALEDAERIVALEADCDEADREAIGKTRLRVEFASDLVEASSDGALV